MVVTASSRRAGRVNNKTKLLVVRGSEKVDLAAAETIVWEEGTSGSGEPTKHQHVGAKGVESGEFLVSRPRSFDWYYTCGGVIVVQSLAIALQRRRGLRRGVTRVVCAGGLCVPFFDSPNHFTTTHSSLIYYGPTTIYTPHYTSATLPVPFQPLSMPLLAPMSPYSTPVD